MIFVSAKSQLIFEMTVENGVYIGM